MTHQYIISGMSCNGCRTKVEKTLNEVEGVQAEVTLNPPTATITMKKHVATEKFQEVLSAAGNYTIEMDSPKNHSETAVKSCCASHKKENHDHKTDGKKAPQHSANGIYYCPMHCEGDKTYNKPGDCPICGMDLVPMQASENEENS